MAAAPKPAPKAASESDHLNNPPKKQAVLLIHGIGEQRPMATLWKLVDLVWTRAPKPEGAPDRIVYSEPDEMSGVFELRRLSTNYNADGKRTDFFEYYWAHLMRGNDLGDVLSWLGGLAARPRDRVPVTLLKAWTILRILLVALAVVFLLGFIAAFGSGVTGQAQRFMTFGVVLAALLGVALAIDKAYISPVIGDAARYLRPSPKNIECRQTIRARGLKLLEDLHASGKYDRIVLVGHSLGGVIAYEIAVHFWGRRNRMMDREGPVQAAIEQAEAAGLAVQSAPGAETLAAWRAAQHALFEALRAETGPDGAPLWLISDLVTMGCPLSHAATLLATDEIAFSQLLTRRELSACPPQYERFEGGRQRFSYCRRHGDADNPEAVPRVPNNASVFAATRWTNLYFPMLGLIRGDLIGGPVADVFGAGVEDIALRAPREGGLFPHMDYFNADAQPPWGEAAWCDHRVALRQALALEKGG
jgi:pimeloyl-ACP methyl ester carboxylesterase